MIKGVGTDLVEVERIRSAWERSGERFARRILVDSEFSRFVELKSDVRYLAKALALKEAVVKSLGTGIAQGVGWHSIETGRDELGRPIALLSGAAHVRMQMLNASNVHVSLSDEKAYILAFAVLD